MSAFLITFFLVYGSMHAYFVWRVRAAVPRLGWWTLAVVAWCVLMVFGPMTVRMLDAAGHADAAYGVGLVAYTWFAVLFWFIVVVVPLDVWTLGVRLVGLGWPAALRAAVPIRWAVALAAGWIVVATAWGVVEVQRIRLVRHEITSPHLPAGSRPVRIALVADLHLGVNTRGGRLGRALEVVRRAEPDLVVSAGDLVESPASSYPDLSAMLAEVDAPLGKFAVTGNHEFYLGLDEAEAFHRAAGFRLLREGTVRAGPHVVVAGVDDPAGAYRTGAGSRMDEDAVLSPRDAARPLTILLKHQPTVRAESVGRFDLQLSGHTHGGQIFPWVLFTRLQYRYPSGLHEVGRGSRLYVSNGTGTWGPPLRVLAPPEVTLIVVRPAAGQSAGAAAPSEREAKGARR